MTVVPPSPVTGVPILTPPAIDVQALRSHRLGRVLAQMEAADVDLVILTSPASLRYTVDWREYPLYQSRIQVYDLFVRRDGTTTLFGGYSEAHPVIDEFRPGHALNVFDGGLDLVDRARSFAADVLAAIDTGGRVASEQINPSATQAMVDAGLTVVDAEPLLDEARWVKSADEIVCLRHSVAVAQAGMDLMRQALVPGVTENELYAILHQVNIANDGDWIDGRMLCSGPRTNPWYQPASDRAVEPGDLLAFDTDMVGPFGYSADISRTWLLGDDPTEDQRDVYRRAHDEITHNAQLLEPGRSFREIADKSFRQPDEFVAHRYTCLAHGLGMTDEYPKIAYPHDWADWGYDGELVADTVLTVESFVGSERGGPGVKLEDMYLETEAGPERLSTNPIEEVLLR
ncbi:MAG: Xaa-Pro peptidase family protein [Actinomycetota bacterium]